MALVTAMAYEKPRLRIELRPGSWTWFINGT